MKLLPFTRRAPEADEVVDEAHVNEILERALAEPPFLDRERGATAAHLQALRHDATRIETEISAHEVEIYRLREELDERHLAISAHEAAEAVLAQSERREAAE